MSAYLVDAERIGHIAHIILDHVVFDGLKLNHKQLCGILAVQNIRSLQARYEPGSFDETVKEWTNGIETLVEYLALSDVPYTDAPAMIDERERLLDSYRYQSCETDDWENTLSCAVTKLALDNLGQDDKRVFKV